jgi:2-polyprenyl-3-methyl-5-hydroxy-6-metoxy-1,4-benzoquinol methylase
MSEKLVMKKYTGAELVPEPIHQCRVCERESGKKSQFTSNGYEWLKCGSCGTVQKILTHQQYLELNPTYDPGSYLDSANREQIERFLGIDQTIKVIAGVTKRYVSSSSENGMKRSFLDVGCGMGAFMLAAKRLDFDVLGFEPSADHAYVATKHLQLPVIANYFSRELIGDRTFDLIMLSHVIEHIFSPKTFLHELIAILKPGGALIVVTPNSDSLVAKFTGRRWPMLKPVDHVTLLSAKAYAHFELEGLADVHHWYSEFPYEFAATIASVVKARMRQVSDPAPPRSAVPNKAAPPPLRELSVKARLLKSLLTIASVPAWLLAAATDKRACLNSAVVRRAS